jgi:SAM-dependent methyltransferase
VTETAAKADTAREFELYARYERDHWWYRGRRAVLARYLARIEDRGAKSLLEVGCGTGGNLRYLFTDFARADGIESDPNALAHAHGREDGCGSVRLGDANRLDVADGSCDVVACFDVLYHERIPSVEAALAEVHRILRPGGFVVVTDGAFGFLAGRHSQTVGGARRFTRRGLAASLRAAGFEVERISYWGFALFFLIFLRRRVLDRLSPPEDGLDLRDNRVLGPFLFLSLWLESRLHPWLAPPFGAHIVALGRKR